MVGPPAPLLATASRGAAASLPRTLGPCPHTAPTAAHAFIVHALGITVHSARLHLRTEQWNTRMFYEMEEKVSKVEWLFMVVCLLDCVAMA